MKVPCKNCICVPVCRHKKYYMLMKCELLQDFTDLHLTGTPDDKTNAINRRIVWNILRPTAWYIEDGWVNDREDSSYKLFVGG